ncbi:MAG: methyltransferase [Pseudomonadota bacterium]
MSGLDAVTDENPEYADLTRDAIFNGRVSLVQPRRGYRFSLDALLLADFAAARPGTTVVDLGAGVGVVSLALARRLGRGRIFAVEIQARPAWCARENFRAAAAGPDLLVLEMDWNDLQPRDLGGPVDFVVANPPFRALGMGRVNPNEEEAAARHEFKGGLKTAIKTAAGILAPKGRMAVIYPAARLAGLIHELKNARLEPKKLRLIHGRPGDPARLALVEARKNGREELTVFPPLFVYGEDGKYSGEVEDVISGRRFEAPEDRPVSS